jgi:hypothetical protein
MAMANVVALATLSCRKADVVESRVDLVRIDGEQFALILKPGQYPYCAVYSVSERGVIRQLTMPADDVSFECRAGEAIAGTTFRAPMRDGKTHLFVLLSSQRLKLSSVTQQLLDVRDKTKLSALDFRLPGSAVIETIDFEPETVAPAAVDSGVQ